MKQKFFRIEWEGGDLGEKFVKSMLDEYLGVRNVRVYEISDKVFGDKMCNCKEPEPVFARDNNKNGYLICMKCNKEIQDYEKPKKIEKLNWRGAVMNGQANGEFVYELKKKQDELIEVVNR